MYGHGGGGGFHGNDHHGPHHGGGGGFGGRGGHDDWGKRPGEDLDGPPSRMRKMDTRLVLEKIQFNLLRICVCRSPDGSENGMRRDGLGGAKSITDLAKRVEKSWEGGLILKNSLFPTKLLLTEGEMEVGGICIMKLSFLMESLFSSIFTFVCSQVVEQLMRDEQDKPYLKITQRLQFLQFLMF